MAAQPDISAILAALAQKPNGTPSQSNNSQNQGAPGTGYPGAPSSSTPSNLNHGLSLPQPSSSGNLDLSAIKPVSSGSVSLADAIATAQGKAAAKSAASDPRLSGRSYVQSRSRSRSPARRDTFRDNYNPYRDERRDDSRRGVNDQDRSFSPAQPALGGYNEHPFSSRVRSPPGRPTENSEIITVESSSVGLIIGRAGENMRRIEQESGARVQFINGPENSGPMRQCRITGNPRQRADAKNEIFRVAADGPQGQSRSSSAMRATPTAASTFSISGNRHDGRTEQIMVPDRTVGLIIGRGGETIRDLQERSGCHVNIVGENKSVNGLRPVNLIGTSDARDRARALIMEVVDSDTRGVTHEKPPMPDYRAYDPYALSAPTPAPAPAPYDPYSGGAKINESMMVPSEAVGMIIGKGGETIKDMQNASGCKINVSQPSGADIERHIELIGTRHACDNAKRLIWEKVNTVREKQGGLTRAPEPPMPPQYGHPPHAQYPPPAYGQPPPMMPPPQSMPIAGPPEAAPPSADPYAAYGGYSNYMALWYAAMAQPGQNGAPPPQ